MDRSAVLPLPRRDIAYDCLGMGGDCSVADGPAQPQQLLALCLGGLGRDGGLEGDHLGQELLDEDSGWVVS
jgi:hypothetical protein